MMRLHLFLQSTAPDHQLLASVWTGDMQVLLYVCVPQPGLSTLHTAYLLAPAIGWYLLWKTTKTKFGDKSPKRKGSSTQSYAIDCDSPGYYIPKISELLLSNVLTLLGGQQIAVSEPDWPAAWCFFHILLLIAVGEGVSSASQCHSLHPEMVK